MFRTERLLKKQLNRWIDTVQLASRYHPNDRNLGMMVEATDYRIPDGRIVPRNETEGELYAVYKEIKAFMLQYVNSQRTTAPFGVAEVLAEKCKQALRNQRPTKEMYDDL